MRLMPAEISLTEPLQVVSTPIDTEISPVVVVEQPPVIPEGSSVDATRQQLSTAARAIKSKKRITKILWFGFGYGGVFGGLILLVILLIISSGHAPGTWQYDLFTIYSVVYLAIVMPVSFCMAGVAFNPTDEKGIARLCIGELVICCMVLLFCIFMQIGMFSIFRPISVLAPSVIPWVVIFIVMVYFQAQTLRTTKGCCCASCCSCCCGGKPEYRMAPRLQLLRCWYASHTLQASLRNMCFNASRIACFQVRFSLRLLRLSRSFLPHQRALRTCATFAIPTAFALQLVIDRHPGSHVGPSPTDDDGQRARAHTDG